MDSIGFARQGALETLQALLLPAFNTSYNTRNMKLIVASLLLFSAACAKRDTAATADLEKKFQESMAGVTLAGNSTRLNKPGFVSAEERYVIEKVSKVSGDIWLFQARVRFESHDLPLPIPITVKWAGDTPMISLTDVSIPGLGTYTARVLIYRDQYAGTWSGKSGGGQMFGKVVRER
jgi:hypothetical protein